MGMNYWPGFVDALSTLVLGIIFLLTVFVVVQFYLTQEVTGKDTLLSRLNAQIAQLTELLALEKTGKLGVEDEVAQMQANLARRAAGSRQVQEPLRRHRQRQLCGADQDHRALRPTRRREERVEPRAGADRGAQPADRGAAPSARLARRRARRLREEGQGIADPHRRSRPAPQRGARAAGAGALALSLGLLRPAARHPRQPARHPRRRRPLRVPVGSVLRFRPGAC